MDANYFYVKDNEPIGPLTLEELLKKDISSKTYVWRKGMENWVMAENMPELFKALQLKTENPPRFQKEDTTHFPKENTNQIKVEPVTPENTLNPNKISTKTILYLIVGTLIIVMLGGYLFLKLEVEKDQENICKDIDGNVYKVVKIGTQYWSGRNLNVSRFRNGDKIPVARSTEDWIKAGKNGQPACCCYDNVGYNCEKYGRLYNWFAVNDPRGLAPDGWHVSTDYEWKNLTDFLGVSAGQILKTTEDWKYSDYDGQGTDDVGFSALPGGYRDGDGSFITIKLYAFFWNANQDGNSIAPPLVLNANNGNVGTGSYDESIGAYVRCLSRD